MGGPYTVVASIPRRYVLGAGRTGFLGASADFSHVLLASTDHALLSGMEGAVAEDAVEGASNLYDWTSGRLQLVNVTNTGSLVNRCGARLGQQEGFGSLEGTNDAVSEDGSKVFFTSPGNEASGLSGPGCGEPVRLYMRVNNMETVEVSAFAPDVSPSKYLEVRYNDATPDGSEVFFNTETPLMGETVEEEEKGLKNKLFEYDTEVPEGERLKLIASGVEKDTGRGSSFVLSEDGSTVYYETKVSGGLKDIYRYDVRIGEPPSVVGTFEESKQSEPLYTTPNGKFLLFVADGRSGMPGVAGEPRGAGHNELYRYDAADGSVMCVSCGQGDAPAKGEMYEPNDVVTSLATSDQTPRLIPMSGDGRYVFFQTSAQLVPQDTNVSTAAEEESPDSLGQDVYEWEADGAGECALVQGCTYLISSGEDVGPSVFLGASSNGRDVFFATAAQLAPQDTDEFGDIYDARVDGGFAPARPTFECLSCQGVGSPPPLFNVPASVSFAGANNPAVKPKPKPKKKTKTKKKSHGKKSVVAGHNRRERRIERGKRS